MLGTAKKIGLIVGGILLALPLLASATASSVDRITDHIEPLIRTDYIKAPYFLASTTRASVLPYASTTAVSSSNLTSGNCVQASTGGLLVTTSGPCASGTVTAVSVSSANGFAGSSSGGATPALTLTTTVTGVVKGNGTALSAAANGTDYTLVTAKTCTGSDFFSAVTAAGVFTCTTPAGTTYTGTYPIIVTGSVISTAFSTTTNWGLGTNGFVVTSNTGVPFVAASSSLSLPNTALQNSSITVNSTSIALGSSGTVTAASSTLLGDNNKFSGTNTFVNSPVFSTLTAGTVNSTSGGTLYNTGTSTPTVTAPITYSGTLGQFIGGVSGTFACTNASAGVTGCLTGTDWSTFNGKQAAGNYITALTGDVTASGPGSVAATLATVNSNVGAFTNANITVNAKGLVTAAANGSASTGNVATSTNETKGQVPYYTSTNGTPALIGAVSTTSLAVSSPLTVTGTFGALLGGTNATINCQTASGTQPGCLSSADWAIFNNKISSTSLSGTGGTTYNSTTGVISSFSYPFPANATTTVLAFTNGFTFAATSTGTNGIDISSGCFAVSGTCLQTFIQNATAYKTAANYATAAILAGTPVYNNGTAGVGATLTEVGTGALTVDGQSPSVGQRILVKNQADQTQNGVYTVTATGSGIASYVLTRATDFDTSNEVYAGVTVPVLAGGTANGDTQWTQSTTGTITMGSSNIVFLETSVGTNVVTSLTGTTNQITASASTGAVTLSFPNLVVFPSNASSTLFSTVYGSTTNAFVGALNLPNISGTQCLHSISGVVSGTGSDCGSGGGLTGSTGQVAYFSGTNTAVGTSTLFINAASAVGLGTLLPAAKFDVQGTTSDATSQIADFWKADGTTAMRIRSDGNVGIGTTSPYALLSINAPATALPYFVIGSSTAEVFKVLSSTGNATVSLNGGPTNPQWNMFNIAGNLFFASSTSGSTATSTFANPNIGSIQFPANGGCIGCSDIHLSNGIDLRNAKYVQATSTDMTAFVLQDIYTAPAGRRAFIQGYYSTNYTGVTPGYRVFAKISGSYYAVSASSTSGATGTVGGSAGQFILEPGESLSVWGAITGVYSLRASLIEYDASVPFKSVRVLNPTASATTTLYTVPAGVSAAFLPAFPAVLAGTGGPAAPVVLAALNQSNASVNVSAYVVKSGQVAINNVNLIATTAAVGAGVLTTSNFLVGGSSSNFGTFALNSGDSIAFLTSASLGTTGIIWTNIFEH